MCTFYTGLSECLLLCFTLELLHKASGATLVTECACFGNDQNVDTLYLNCTSYGGTIQIKNLFWGAKLVTTGCPITADTGTRDVDNCCTYVDDTSDCTTNLTCSDSAYADCTNQQTCSKWVAPQQASGCAAEFLQFTNYMCTNYYCATPSDTGLTVDCVQTATSTVTTATTATTVTVTTAAAVTTAGSLPTSPDSDIFGLSFVFFGLLLASIILLLVLVTVGLYMCVRCCCSPEKSGTHRIHTDEAERKTQQKRSDVPGTKYSPVTPISLKQIPVQTVAPINHQMKQKNIGSRENGSPLSSAKNRREALDDSWRAGFSTRLKHNGLASPFKHPLDQKNAWTVEPW